jgi:hypothetical protein
VEIRRARLSDYAGICELAEANYVRNLSPSDRQQGFLSAQFTVQQIDNLATDLGIMTACDNERVVGFACASRCDLADLSLVAKIMITTFTRVYFRGQPLSAQKVFIYGPACIDILYRGRGILRGMYGGLLREMAGRYDVGVSLVAEDNIHSLHAHTEGLGMRVVGSFTHEEHGYHILAFPVPTRDEAKKAKWSRKPCPKV